MIQGETSSPPSTGPSDMLERLCGRFDHALEELGAAKPFAKSTYQTNVFQIAETLMGFDKGMRALFARASRFEEVGLFDGGPWVDSTKLQAPLVAGSLKAGGVYPVVETLSELRMLAMATGKVSGSVSQLGATEFLNEVMALNLEFIFPGDTEEERLAAGPHREANARLFALISEELGLGSLRSDVVSEIEQTCAQRPIMTGRVRRMIEMAARIPRSDQPTDSVDRRLEKFKSAIHGPTELTQRHAEASSYRDKLGECNKAALELEARAFAEAMISTGLCCPLHAVLLRHLRTKAPDLIPTALALNEMGIAELDQNKDFVLQLIRFSVFPATAQSILGVAKTLEYGLLSRQEVTAGVERLIDLDLNSEVRRNLLAHRRTRDGITANALLVAGVITVFGQPIGLGQGRNPTCQAARAISLWAQHAHGYLLELLISAARDGFIEIPFEAERLRSDELTGGVATRMDFDMDPVSIVLVPHLDRIYDAMMTRVVLRQEDGHRWVNPALYGRWVPNGFASVFADRAQTTVADYDEFVRRFFATHHPSYNEGYALMYPNPVGILVTNSQGTYLGPHAVALQRIEESPQGVLRAYFFNPNNEGRQDWGSGVKPSIEDHGEREGESSLPFHEFASRLYAFHYNPYEEGDAYAVPAAVIEEVEAAARSTWGKAFTWVG